MNCTDFKTSPSVEEMAAEITCLKATMALLLKAIAQADSGKVLINLEKMITEHENSAETEVYVQALQQMKSAYRE